MADRVEGRRWIPAFSGLRFLVCLLLILHHFDMFNDLNIAGWPNIIKFFSEGYLSVNFFFMLSGFVIQYNYAGKPKLPARAFLFKRIAHLWPTYLLCLFMALFIYWGFSNGLAQLVHSPFWCHFFMVQSWVPLDGLAFSYNGLAWSISTELFFYIAFVFLVRVDRRTQHGMALGIWAIIFLNVMVMGLQSPIANWIYYINPLFRLGDFMLGMWLCDLFQSRKVVPETVKSATLLELASLAALMWMVIIAATSEIDWEWRWQIYYTVPVAFLIYAFSFSKGIVSKLLGSKAFLFLGKIAFPLYLVHQICLSVVKRLLAPMLASWQALLLAGFLATGVAVVLSILIEFFVTEPADRWLKRRWNIYTEKQIKEGQI